MAKAATQTKFKLRPLADRVIVKREEEEEARTPAGIVIPDSAKERPVTAKVIAVGPGKRDENGNLHPIAVEPGQRVVVSKYAGTEIKLDGEEYVIVREDDILAVFE